MLHVRRLSDDFKVKDEFDGETGMEDHNDFTLEKVAEKVVASPFHCLHFFIWNWYVTMVISHLCL